MDRYLVVIPREGGATTLFFDPRHESDLSAARLHIAEVIERNPAPEGEPCQPH
jgi:hypothetical protein